MGYSSRARRGGQPSLPCPMSQNFRQHVNSIEGRIVNFVSVTEKDGLRRNLHSENVDAVEKFNLGTKIELMNKVSIAENATNHQDQSNDEGKNLRELSIRTLDSWFEMISRAKKMMRSTM